MAPQEDVDALEHLVDIKCVDKEDMSGFELQFTFSENEYFTNTVLTKAYEIPNMLEVQPLPPPSAAQCHAVSSEATVKLSCETRSSWGKADTEVQGRALTPFFPGDSCSESFTYLACVITLNTTAHNIIRTLPDGRFLTLIDAG